MGNVAEVVAFCSSLSAFILVLWFFCSSRSFGLPREDAMLVLLLIVSIIAVIANARLLVAHQCKPRACEMPLIMERWS